MQYKLVVGQIMGNVYYWPIAGSVKSNFLNSQDLHTKLLECFHIFHMLDFLLHNINMTSRATLQIAYLKYDIFIVCTYNYIFYDKNIKIKKKTLIPIIKKMLNHPDR